MSSMVVPHDTQTANSILQRVESEAKEYRNLGLLSDTVEDLIPTWHARVRHEPTRFLTDGFSIDVDALRNFRRRRIFVTDSPSWDPSPFNPKNLVSGSRRGTKRVLRENLEVLKQHGYDDLLVKYPCPSIGNPHIFQHQGFRYTFRWFKHIYFLGLTRRVLGGKLDPDMVALDIGSSYGVFSGLLKNEYPDSHHILVDFSEQLLLARYFLSMYFPGARIAGIKDLVEAGTISRDFVQSYDFVLVPVNIYDSIAPASADLVMNFSSFGEMSKKWLNHYLESPPFRTARYFLTSNRVQRINAENLEINILDYPVLNPGKKLHFGISPVWTYVYRRRRLFLGDAIRVEPHFEYIGEI